MRLPFLDRDAETERLRGLIRRGEGAMGVLYGRRRVGKSRILREAVPAEGSVYFVGDDRDASLQRASLAREVGRMLPGFEGVDYPEWEALLARWWREAPPGTVLILDELPSLVAKGPELPSLLQKHLDADAARGVHLLVAGSSQRMIVSPPPSSETPVVTPNRSRSSAASCASACQNSGGEAVV